ncbi:SseB family protein [Nereida sp. MMG025]|uniref:SseB family protein n=1 Tax=Nereida sp. MMG025 TaxID=2909981 RepID=UPI001F384E41|nr:SseB family protein [Nereida sp. MMG025]MCF6445444.1 SseB family protein [Nereida sp. MMG025]
MSIEQTQLDAAHADMDASDAARLRFYECLAASELFLLLSKEADGEDISPDVFEVEGNQFVLVFDRIERLTAFAEKSVPYVAVSGRVLAQMLAGQGIGLGVNLSVAPSEVLIPSDAVDWLHQTLGNRPTEMTATPKEIRPPTGLPEHLVSALDAKLATASGLANHALLVSVVYDDNSRGSLLAFIDAAAGAEGALAQAVGEVLTFSGLDAGVLDVGFLRSADPIVGTLQDKGLRFDLPQLVMPDPPKAPGMDPDKPPRLI